VLVELVPEPVPEHVPELNAVLVRVVRKRPQTGAEDLDGLCANNVEEREQNRIMQQQQHSFMHKRDPSLKIRCYSFIRK
jgi:hypothetical protein